MSIQQKVFLGVVLAVALAGGAWFFQNASADAASAKAVLVLNVTSGAEDLHRVTMALQLAGHALDDGRDVLVFLNVRAPVFATKNCPDSMAFRRNPPIREMLASLMERGAKVHVCPHCMMAMGVAESDLMPGAEVTTREKLFSYLGPNSHVFSY